VSLPITILCLLVPLVRGSRFLNTYAAARPSLSAVSAVTGSMLAMPRTPSVPKIRLFEFAFMVELYWVTSTTSTNAGETRTNIMPGGSATSTR